MEIEAQTAAYAAMYALMNRHYYEGREEEAFDLAARLLQDEELPPLIRACCHMMLSTDDENPSYLEHAEEAVRLLDEDCRALVPAERFPQIQYDEALRLLAAARGSQEEDIAASGAEEAALAEQISGAAEDEEMLLTAEMEQEFLMPAVAGQAQRKKKKVRRIDSGYSEGDQEPAQRYEEFDKTSKAWVPLGTADEPAAEDEDLEMLLQV